MRSSLETGVGNQVKTLQKWLKMNANIAKVRYECYYGLRTQEMDQTSTRVGSKVQIEVWNEVWSQVVKLKNQVRYQSLEK